MERAHVFLACSLQRALKGRSGTTASGRLSIAAEKQEEGKAAGYILRTGLSGGPGFRREPTREGLLDRLGQSINAFRVEDSFGGGESDVPVDFSSAEDQSRPNDVPMVSSILGY